MNALTVVELAGAKRLPPEFLQELGLRDVANGVAIPYRDRDGRELFQRVRLSLDGERRFRQPTGTPLQPYGLERLGEARAAGYILLVEGESDCWSCWFNNVPALGIPGASAARVLEPEHLDRIGKVFAWREPDDGGSTFIEGVARRLGGIDYPGEACTIAIPGVKDLADLHAASADDPSAFDRALGAALDHADVLSLSALDARPAGFRTVAEYLAEVQTRSSKKAFWAGIAREGELSMMTGRAFSGKSTFACALTRSLRLAIPLLGRACLRAKVGYMALERNGVAVARLFEKWGLAQSIHFLDELPVMPLPELARFLEREILENGLEVVIVDHLQNLVHVRDSKDYSMVSTALEPLQHVAKNTGAHIMLLHHQGKVEREGIIDVMGSEAYRAGTDALIEARKHAGQYFIRAEVRGEVDLPKTRVNVNLATGEVASVDAAQAEIADAQTAIGKYLSDQTEPVTVDAIQEGVALKRAIVLDAIKALIDRGALARTGAGRRGDPFLYSVPTLDHQHREPNRENAQKPNGEKDLFRSHESGNGRERNPQDASSGTESEPELGTPGTSGTAGTESARQEEF